MYYKIYMQKIILLFGIILVLCSCEVNPDISFAPDIITGDTTNVRYTTATIDVSIQVKSLSTEVGVVYSTTESTPMISNSQYKSLTVLNKGDNLIYLTGLDFGKTYLYRAYATDGKNVKYGNLKSFTTKNTNVVLETGVGVNLGYNSTESFYLFSVSATLTGFSQIKEWGMEVSAYPNMLMQVRNAFPATQWTDGNLYTQYWFSSRPSYRYFRTYALLNSSDTIRGYIKSVLLSQ